MKKFLKYIFVGLIFSYNFSFAQKGVQMEQYMFNQMQFNPAYAGSTHSFQASFLHNSRWIGFEGAPNIQVLNVHTPLFANAAIGASLVHESIGVSNNFDLFGVYAYEIKLIGYSISLGVQGGIISIKDKNSQLTTTDTGDEQYKEDIGFTNFNAGFGIFCHSDNYYIGLSFPKFMENTYSMSGKKNTNSFNPLGNPYYLTGGYVHEFNELIKLKPSILLKHLFGSPISIDLNINALYKNKFGLGAFYRFNSAFGFMFEYYIYNTLKVGYAWHLATSKLIAFNYGTHEIMVSYNLHKFQAKSYQSPRFF
jgi:type IX secretion system PorP/SprF family membrane protein